MPLEIIDRFAAEHFTLNSISEQRRHQVITALERLTLATGKPLTETTDGDLRAWLVAMLEEDGFKPSTVGWYLTMVLPFFRWCWQQRIIDADQLMRLREVKPPRGHSDHLPRPYPRKELALFWDQLDAAWPYTSELALTRWRNGGRLTPAVRKHIMRLQLDAIIELALVCGLRRNEIYSLSIDDVHWDNAYIVVNGKRVNQNARVREVPYPDSTRFAVQRWLRMRAELSPQPGLPIWLSVTGRDPASGLNRTRMSMILRSFGEWELHRLRHTCATERLRAGMELEKLREFLGHSNISRTLRYAQLVRDDVHKSSARTDAEFQRAIRRAA